MYRIFQFEEGFTNLNLSPQGTRDITPPQTRFHLTYQLYLVVELDRYKGPAYHSALFRAKADEGVKAVV
jgi:hypothetical protein